MRTFKTILRWLFGVAFIFAGINHFIMTDFYLRMMPPYLPWHLALVYISGVAESGLGAMLLFKRWKKLAGWGLIALLIAVFPANLQMALHPEEWPELTETQLWLRLPFQAPMIALAYWFSRED